MSRVPDDFSGLTDAFLGAPKAKRSARAEALPTLLVVGNVPTLAGIWIAQFADQQAKMSGPVALVRIDGAASRGEVYRVEGRALPTEGSAWLERSSAFVHSWIVCVDCQSDASAIARSGYSIVLLTGADETAVAAAKRTIDAIVQAGKSAGEVVAAMGIAFVGCTESAARTALDSLSQWSRERALGIRFSFEAHSPRVDRVESTGPVPLAMLTGLDVAAALEFVGLAIQGNPSRYLDHVDHVDHVDHADQTRPMQRVVSDAPGSMSQSTPKTTPKNPPIESSVAAAMPPSPRPAVENGAAPAPTSAGNSQEYFPEWTHLVFVCPDAPGIHLASDGSGALCVLHSSADGSALRIASSWARANWNLLCAACNQLDSSRPRIFEHILLNDAKDGALLHRTGVLLHARVDVVVDGIVVRRRVDLNTAQTAGITA